MRLWYSGKTLKNSEMLIGVGVIPLRCTAAIMTDDAIDRMLDELSTFSYIVGLSMINMLRDNMSVSD